MNSIKASLLIKNSTTKANRFFCSPLAITCSKITNTTFQRNLRRLTENKLEYKDKEFKGAQDL